MLQGKRIAVLLGNPVENDYRVIKTIRSLSQYTDVDLYYIDGDVEKDKRLFNEKVTLFTFSPRLTYRTKVIKHTYFCYEYNFLIKVVEKENYDVIWANDLPMLYPGFKIAKNIGADLVYDSHEIYTETINQFFPTSQGGAKSYVFNMLIRFMKWHGRRVERNLMPASKFIFTVNESLKQYFEHKYFLQKVRVLMNWPNAIVDEGFFDFRSEFGWEKSDHVLLYQGVLNEGRGLKFLVKSMKTVEDNYKLIILGDGVIKSQLIKIASELNLHGKIQFMDKVPAENLLFYTKGADIGVNLLEPINLSKKYASPNKMFEYIHAGIPVLCSSSVENKRVIDKFDVGVLIDNDIESFIAGLNLIVEKYKKNNVEIVKAREYYCWENQEHLLQKIIK